MTLKRATELTRSFKYNGKEITPAISDDWVFSVETMYSYGDKPIIRSEKLGVRVTLSTDTSHFLKNHIFSGKIKLEKDKLIGEFAFNKQDIIYPDEFNEAVKIVEENAMVETIPNDELIEYGIYLDDKGDKFVYLGNRSFNYRAITRAYTEETTDIFQYQKRKKQRYILTYNDNLWQHKVIVKTSKRRFVEFLGKLSSEEEQEVKLKLFKNDYYVDVCIISKDYYDTVEEIKTEAKTNNYLNQISFAFMDNKYYVIYKSSFSNYDMKELDFDKFSKSLNKDELNFMDYTIGDVIPKIYIDELIKKHEDFYTFKIFTDVSY